MNYLGDFHLGQRVRYYLSTHDRLGANVAPSSAFEAADFIVYKNGDAAQITAGITVTSPFDGEIGFHLVDVDTRNDAYARAADYTLCLACDETIDGQTITAVPLAQFSVENRNPQHGGFRTTIATMTSQTVFRLTDAPLEANALRGWTIVVKHPTADHRHARSVIDEWAATTKELTLPADPGVFAMAVGDIVEVIPGGADVLAINGNPLSGGGATAADYV